MLKESPHTAVLVWIIGVLMLVQSAVQIGAAILWFHDGDLSLLSSLLVALLGGVAAAAGVGILRRKAWFWRFYVSWAVAGAVFLLMEIPLPLVLFSPDRGLYWWFALVLFVGYLLMRFEDVTD